MNEDQDRVIADVTSEAKFTSSDEKVAKVDATGRVTGTGSGEATITATWLARQVQVKVMVEGDSAGWSFRNHLIPTFTRFGCNSGACHGALAGKGGMKLSLRGFDPDSDWFVLTRQALARRVDLTRPTESLMLKKPAKLIPHGGGTRFVEGDDTYNMILAWIKVRRARSDGRRRATRAH